MSEEEKSSLIEDFVSFRKERSTESRERLVGRICEHYNEAGFADSEKQVVHEIISILAQDVEVQIRKVLAENLKDSEDLPRETAIRMASDVEDVSVPMLQFSKVFTDDDLTMIIGNTDESEKLKAIAGRENITEKVADGLIEKHQEEVTETLLTNDTAKISEEGVNKIVEDYGSSDKMMRTLVNRGGLEVAVAERVITLVSDELQREIGSKYDLDPAKVKEKFRDIREEMTLNVVSDKSRTNSTDMVNHLHSSGKLTHSIVLRALCRGDLEFFEAGVAKLANIPLANAKKLLREGSMKGFSALFGAAAMPETMMEASHVLLGVVYEMDEKGETDRPDFESKAPQMIMERIVTNGYDQSVPNMGYMMALIQANKSQ